LDNAKHPIEEFRNDSSGIIQPHGQSTERKHCPPTVFDANTVKGHVDHPFHETKRSWVITEDAWKPAQSNKTPPCPRFDRLLEHRHDLGGILFLGEAEIPDLTSQVNPDPHVSTGVSETNTSPTLIREFGSNRLNLHPVGLTKSETGNDNAKPVITVNQGF